MFDILILVESDQIPFKFQRTWEQHSALERHFASAFCSRVHLALDNVSTIELKKVNIGLPVVWLNFSDINVYIVINP